MKLYAAIKQFASANPDLSISAPSIFYSRRNKSHIDITCVSAAMFLFAQ